MVIHAATNYDTELQNIAAFQVHPHVKDVKFK